MEYRAYLEGINSNEICIDRLHLKSCAGNLEIICQDAGKPGAFRKLVHLLQTGLIIYGYEHDWKELIALCGAPVFDCPQKNENNAAVEITDHVWEEIRWIFQSEYNLAAYWFGVSLTAKELPRRYVAIYYAAKRLSDSGKWPDDAGGLLERLKTAADAARLDEEDLGERGLEIPEVAFDPELLNQAEKTVIRQFR